MALENAHFSFLQFLIFQCLEGFSKKTYEKTCRFYNKFSKSSSNCTRLRSFTIWIFFSKISWPFQFNVHFFHFPPLLRENLWKDVPILWLISKLSIIMCTFAKILSSGSFFKKNGCCFNILTIYDSFVQFGATFATKFMKRPTIFFTYFQTSTLFLQVYKVSSLANQ